MSRFFKILVVVTALFFAAACGGGKSEEKCPDGYKWEGGDCVKTGTDTNTDYDIPSGSDADTTPVSDSDPAEEPDDTPEQPDTDSDGAAYNGSCRVVNSKKPLTIDIVTSKLTIGAVTVNGVQEDPENYYGEIWAENLETSSEFMIAQANAAEGKSVDVPRGSYAISYKPLSSSGKVVIHESVDLSGDKSVDINIPLYHLTGKVLDNTGGQYSLGEADGSAVKMTLKNGSFTKEIPYSQFGGFDLLLPKGKYAVLFNGPLFAGQPDYNGTIFESDSENAVSIVNEDVEKDIKIIAKTVTGTISKPGYPVSEGRLVLAENPPLGNVVTVVASSVADASYTVVIPENRELALLYLPTADSYPARYIKLETWNDTLTASGTHAVSLDFARVYGKLTFKGGNSFPTIENCQGDCGEDQAECYDQCTIGKLRARGADASMITLLDLGKTAPGEEGVSYEGLLVRRIPAQTDEEGNVTNYSPKSYTMVFDSYLNDAPGLFSSSSFIVPATYKTFVDNGETASEVTATSFGFSVTQADGSVTWLQEKEINFDVSPSLVQGSITVDGSPAATESADDIIKLRDSNGAEYPVMNLSTVSGGSFSFYAPDGSFDVVYEGSGVLGSSYRANILSDPLVIDGDTDGVELGIKTAKLTLNFDVNGKSFANWYEAEKEDIEAINIVANIDKTAANFTLPVEKKGDNYEAKLLTGNAINAYLEIVFKDSVESQKSYARLPILLSQTVNSNITASTSQQIVKYATSIKLNGEKLDSPENYVAKLRIPGKSPSEIYYPDFALTGYFKQGEYKTPRPEVTLHDGFDAKIELYVDCLYFGE